MKGSVIPYTVKAAYLPAGEQLIATNNTVRGRRHLTFTADIRELGAGKLILGHGYQSAYGSWVEITATQVYAYSYVAYPEPVRHSLLREEMCHGLTVTDFLTVALDYLLGEKMLRISIFTATGSFQGKIPRWWGQNGEISARFEGIDGENCVLNWSCDDFARRIWLIGDS